MEEQTPSEALTLTDEEQELVQAELAALLPALSGERRSAYQALADAVEQKAVSPDLLPLLEGLVKLALETGRARRLYRAEGERILTDLFRKTPSGKELSRSLHEVNKALAVLEGQPLRGVRVAMRTLGHFTVTIETDTAVVTFAVRPDAVTVDSVSVGGEAGLG
ncbi:hypothetical protein HRbin17_01091 [bacterium HR17]|jgi:hypothetical protein|uniref:Uncharacterized protein n=1 Tax=Candidatus Fervidibacter japonicus TaxID=2035412 RepID=A0A2H5XBL2_9BACT|nr:hypothetical protein HRbin17_01091 [bacterium HR17]